MFKKTCTYERRRFADINKLISCGNRRHSKHADEHDFEALSNNTNQFELKRTPSEKGRGRFFNITRVGSFTHDHKEAEIKQERLETDEQNNFKDLQDEDTEESIEFGDPCIVKHQAQTDIEERFRQVHNDIKRLEGKIEILLSALERQGLPNNFKSRTTSV